VVNLTDDSGSTVASYHLDAWGNFRFPSELDASRNRFAFTGYEWDPELGLFNAKARYFDPQIGRFTSQDSFLGQIDNPPSLHRYFYGNANPVRFVDPTGRFGLDLKSVWTGIETTASAVQSVAQGAFGAYQTAKQQVIARQGADIADTFGIREWAVAGQMLRNAEQGRMSRTAGAPGSVAEAGIEGFKMEAVASILETPSNTMASLTNLALPGGFGMWQGQGPSDGELAYAPARQQQVAGLNAAMDSSLPMAERAAHGFAAVATTPVVIAEGLTWGAGGRASDAVGEQLYKAATAPTLTDAALHGLQAGQEGLAAFAAFGALAAPLSGGGGLRGAAPLPGEADFIGPIRPLRPGQPGFIGPVEPHGNSLASTRPSHVYRIDGPDGLYKIGESGGGVRGSDGASIRAERQVRSLIRETGDFYESRIIKVADKASARAYETRVIERYSRRFGRPPGNPLDR